MPISSLDVKPPDRPLENATTRSSRGNEAQFSAETEAIGEPPHVGCYFLNRLLGGTERLAMNDTHTASPVRGRVAGATRVGHRTGGVRPRITRKTRMFCNYSGGVAGGVRSNR